MINILKKIIKIRSINPSDNGCQNLIKYFFKKIGFQVFTFKIKNVTNSIFFRYPFKKIDYLFLGHTDVVPENKLKKWKFSPFKIGLNNKKIYGRGIVDMKSSIVCFLCAVKNIIKNINNKKNFMILLTSDEEGNAKYGTKKIIKIIKRKKFSIENSIIGEPTSEKKIFDVVKNGRRGSYNLKIKIIGNSGHSAYNNFINPIVNTCKFINILYKFKLKKKNNVQVTILKTINKSINVIPEEVIIFINIRYKNKKSINSILNFISSTLKKIKSNHKILKLSNSKPFYLKSKNLLNKIFYTLKKFKVRTRVERFSGGTSDGRFLKSVTKNLVEIGLLNKTAHKINENSKLKDLYKLLIFYYKLMI